MDSGGGEKVDDWAMIDGWLLLVVCFLVIDRCLLFVVCLRCLLVVCLVSYS